ncbi:MAG: putative dehydrogenase [Frankiales bacterium]|nr:putative dehydrogenase [Frankiales bacterium]
MISPAHVTAFARAAEESGFDALGFTDHPAPSGNWVRAGGEGSIDPFAALGFCAAVTSTIKLLTFVLVLPYRNPFLAAHQLATLDHLSGGRLIVGAGTGYLKSEMLALGVDPASRLDAFDQAWAVMTEAWGGQDVSAEGRGFSTRGTKMQPLPVQQPHPPLWVHGNSRFGRERAARLGQGWLVVMGDEQQSATIRTRQVPDLVALRDGIDEVRELTEAAGRPPVEVVVAGRWPMLDLRQGWDADQRREQVAELEALGVDWMAMLSCGDDPSAAEESLRKLGEDVIAR